MPPLVLPLALALLVLAVVGCARDGGSAPDPTRPELSAPDLPTVSPSEESPVGEVPSEILNRIVDDAADRSGVEPDEIEVLTAMAMTWSDGSLDCPEPGMMYTQALVDGYHVVVDAAGEELDYRVTTDGGFRLCEQDGRSGGG